MCGCMTGAKQQLPVVLSKQDPNQVMPVQPSRTEAMLQLWQHL